MRLFLFGLFVSISSCLNAPQPNFDKFRVDDLYCWTRDKNGAWQANGIPESCPLGTVFGYPDGV